MEYIKLNENNEPENYSISRLRSDNPNVSFPQNVSEEICAEYGVYKVYKTALPAYNNLTQRIMDSVVNVDGTWTQIWTAIDLPTEVSTLNMIDSIASDRYDKETSGINWADSDNVVWHIATDLDSQQRLNSTVSAINNNIRTTSGYWKCQKLVAGELTTAYRMTTNDEIIGWARLVHEHVQKCFDAETNAVTKVRANDFTTSFEAEYDLL